MNHPPTEPQPRPKIAQWLFDRRISCREAAKGIGCSYEQLRRVGLPFSDPDHRPASQKLRQKIAAYTGGDVGVNDWGGDPARPYASRASHELEGAL